MRLIHTSDWHLGQYFFTKSRAAEHQAFLRWLIEQVERHQVDAVIVAGDIFDTGSPPSYARELLSCLNTRVIATVGEDLSQQVLTLNHRDGTPGAVLCAIPFLRPRDLIASQAGQSGSDKQLALQEAIAAHYDALYQAAQAERQKLGLPLPIIATGHLTTVGVSTSDSVRDIYIGTLDAFPAQAFPPVDYVALGHIHRAQCVAKTEHIRYSGSPIALSFDELSKAKSVYLLDFSGDRLNSIDTLEIPQFQPMQMIKGSLAEIEQQLKQFSDAARDKPVWLDIEVATQDYLSDIQRRIQALTAELAVEVVLLRRSKEQRLNSISQQEKETLSELSVSEVFERRLALESEVDERRQNRMRTLFAQIVEQVQSGESAEDGAQ